ncbi:hypothetical protein OW495_20365 [Vibrio sp. 14N.309.X.WAT.E.F5]|nr:hypothetical protein [Vibrio sp. 14N.309.X.WAT.E.F5]
MSRCYIFILVTLNGSVSTWLSHIIKEVTKRMRDLSDRVWYYKPNKMKAFTCKGMLIKVGRASRFKPYHLTIYTDCRVTSSTNDQIQDVTLCDDR